MTTTGSASYQSNTFAFELDEKNIVTIIGTTSIETEVETTETRLRPVEEQIGEDANGKPILRRTNVSEEVTVLVPKIETKPVKVASFQLYAPLLPHDLRKQVEGFMAQSKEIKDFIKKNK
jgi:hypothetical protein